jgi:hypothetical protein
VWLAAGSDPGLSSVQYWGGQLALVLVTLIGAWFALGGKKVDRSTSGDQIADQRQARIDAGIAAGLERANAEILRLDRELGEAYADLAGLRAENQQLWRRAWALERALHHAGVDPTTIDGGRA